ncbi:aminomethyl-transferring glycine dehydrogenase [Bartonella quintana]|uniref:Glycine dehydrogenase (decarboxylating) n=1 Tax=Bartonella quintana JK 68 TaxID=1134503 RepID=A0ABR4SNM0_BARQI|nr:aminomethyl-transferring glycine dehydrogenase [Bartonella quintana]ETS11932.1 glycine dehydrogenase [decarboxylating] [Bartonella quintana BQ2-D70]KEC57639.1 glycine dehydrogenase [decarboxylating] [Bartonella quintana JK 19]KEC60779.1 glycine dehydrogenase [decarboxylating] [Bartonella quintana JK 31]KEC61378.1 glycine dehydrogenase [decarboxylating] [Bartonella quintana JK 63]KEC64677.1 glycine dehydrogenase [decarboxylating] [Bartonella quintana JK 68]
MQERSFFSRHIGLRSDETQKMLDVLGLDCIDTLVSQAIPHSIHLGRVLNLPKAVSEGQALEELSKIMGRNHVHKSFIGQGYHGTCVPPVILRNLFENPAWYTAYTPYQAEISQGRLELLFYFQTLISELTGLPVAAASLLDEATALAEANAVAVRFAREKKTKISLQSLLHPQILSVVQTRAETQGISISENSEICSNTAAIVLSWPDTKGFFNDYSEVIKEAKAKGALVIVVADPLALTLMEPPAQWGADIVVGSMQRYGVPMGFGGPHAGYLAVSDALTRLIPGRIVGQSVDTKGRVGFRLALQTREQHIRRDKATSNICTAQALLANMATAYAVWHGPQGLQEIAQRIHSLTCRFMGGLEAAGIPCEGESFFDCVSVVVKGKAQEIARQAKAGGRLVRILDDDRVAVNFDELSTEEDACTLAQLFGAQLVDQVSPRLWGKGRDAAFLSQPFFHVVHSETDMMRFLRRLSDKDLALDRAMIPLGSCTMKLNAAAELMPVSWPTVANIHPFVPKEDAAGYQEMINQLNAWLCEITGFAQVSFQPNSGAQGEYAGLLAIRRYYQSRGENQRTLCLVPASAHGTNPASAHMAGMEVVVVKCLSDGDVDIDDLKMKAQLHKDRLAALMITYPSTHGVYEENIKDICSLIHENGGQVYFDGANLNALVGLTRPADIGADVCHMNLHKTFAIPHGGGGPGVGPIGVAEHLKPFLPGHAQNGTTHAVSAAPYGSASILVITWMYIRMMGAKGLKYATQTAILNANYIAERLSQAYSILYRGKHGRVAHECIVDTRVLKEQYGVSVDDIAKRLIDYGFHAPTMSFPVPGTLMIEPTESEPKAEIDRFCDALLSIAEEAKKVGAGVWPKDDNPLVNAPHTLVDTLDDAWVHPYSRQEAAFPNHHLDPTNKYWPPVSRIDNVAGDRVLICSCPPLGNTS